MSAGNGPAAAVQARAIRLAAALALAVLVADQIAKVIVRATLEPGEDVGLILGAELTRVSNDGIAFGLLGDAGAALVVVGVLAFLILIGYFLAHGTERGAWLVAGLIAGGALGNLLDRLALGSVTDFVDLPAWPAFNLADAAITAGIVLLVAGAVFGSKGEGTG